MDKQKYWFYDEVEISKSFHTAPYELFIETPWLKIVCQVKAQQVGRIDKMLALYRSGSRSTHVVSELSWFIDSLKSQAIFYFLPRTQFEKNLDIPTTKPHNVEFETESSDWVFHKAFEFATTKAGTDPLSFYSYIRRLHLLDMCEKISGKNGAAVLPKQNLNIELIRAILEGISQKIKLWPQSFECLEQLKNKHESRLNSILQISNESHSEFDRNPDMKPLHQLIKVFEISSQTNDLAFVTLLDFLDRIVEHNFEPPSSESFQDRSHGGITTQFMSFNEAQAEHPIHELLVSMGPVTKDYAFQAFALSSTASSLCKQVIQSC